MFPRVCTTIAQQHDLKLLPNFKCTLVTISSSAQISFISIYQLSIHPYRYHLERCVAVRMDLEIGADLYFDFVYFKNFYLFLKNTVR